MSRLFVFCLFCLSLSAEVPQVPYLFNHDKELRVELGQKEEMLIKHVKHCLEASFKNQSKLNARLLKLDGMSGSKTRHLLNNLCALPNCNYFEIGTWKGSTFVSALFENTETVKAAVAVDNWAQFPSSPFRFWAKGPRESFWSNCKQFLPYSNYKVCEEDCFALNTSSLFNSPVNVYFYDGNHEEIDQEMAFTYFNEIFDDVFIAVVDDWNWDWIRKGTFAAFNKLGYKVVFEYGLPCYSEFDPLPNKAGESDKKRWWNGIYIAVIHR